VVRPLVDPHGRSEEEPQRIEFDRQLYSQAVFDQRIGIYLRSRGISISSRVLRFLAQAWCSTAGDASADHRRERCAIWRAYDPPRFRQRRSTAAIAVISARKAESWPPGSSESTEINGRRSYHDCGGISKAPRDVQWFAQAKSRSPTAGQPTG
jgi:hypothetical protein